jgi:two-component system, cell cycle response regulator
MKILVAEDDKITLKLLESRLRKWGNEVVACSDGLEAWERLQEPEAPTLVILDWMMPGMPGVNICRKIREMNRRPYVYVILLTAKNRKEDILEGLEAGADDYIIKPFDPHELEVRVRAGARIVKLQEDLMAALQVADYRASHDGLTGLWNRTAVLDIGSKELERSQREDRPFTLAMADLDHFKRINDQYGHPAGDEVLREVARRLVSSVRTYDSVGRVGGEEFVMVLPGCSREEGRTIAERLRASISGTPVVTPEGLIPITMSFGVTEYRGRIAADMPTLLKNADEALYKAKSKGRNRVEVSPRDVPAMLGVLMENRSDQGNAAVQSGLAPLQVQRLGRVDAVGQV